MNATVLPSVHLNLPFAKLLNPIQKSVVLLLINVVKKAAEVRRIMIQQHDMQQQPGQQLNKSTSFLHEIGFRYKIFKKGEILSHFRYTSSKNRVLADYFRYQAKEINMKTSTGRNLTSGQVPVSDKTVYSVDLEKKVHGYKQNRTGQANVISSRRHLSVTH